ncbi:E3 [Bat mastadenovirus]|nr:E3 [Bat mastadenovirus]
MRPELKFDMQEAESTVKTLHLHKMENVADFEVLAICWGLGLFFFTCVLLMICYYKYRVSQWKVITASAVSLLPGAEAVVESGGEEGWKQLWRVMSWWDVSAVVMLVVAAICTLCVLIYVCWKYPPRCRRDKGLWITAPLLLLMVASPAGADHLVPNSAQAVAVGSSVVFNLHSPNFTQVNWTKICPDYMDLAQVNKTDLDLIYHHRNISDLGWMSVFHNGSLKISNVSEQANGTYAAHVDSQYPLQLFYLTVVPPVRDEETVPAPTYSPGQHYLTVEKGQSVWMNPQKNFSELLWMKHTWNESIPVAFVNVSQVDIFNTHNRTGLISIYINGTLKLSNLPVQARGNYEARYNGTNASSDYFALFVQNDLLAPALHLMRLNASQCGFLCRCAGENITLQTIKGNETITLNTTSAVLDPKNVSMVRCTAWRDARFRATLVSIQEVCKQTGRRVKYVYVVVNDYWWLLLIALLLFFFVLWWFHGPPLRINFNRHVAYMPLVLLLIAVPGAESIKNHSAPYDSFHGGLNQPRCNLDWWIYALGVLAGCLLVLLCVVCGFTIRAQRNAWFFGPLVLLTIVCQSSTLFVPILEHPDSGCHENLFNQIWLREEAVGVSFNATFTLEIKCLKDPINTAWYVGDGYKNDLFLQFEHSTFSIVPENLGFCAGYSYSLLTFSCLLKSDIKLITIVSKTHTQESYETIFFNYGNVESGLKIVGSQHSEVVLHCYYNNNWFNNKRNILTWLFNDKQLFNTEMDKSLNPSVQNDFSLKVHLTPQSIGNYECRVETKSSLTRYRYFYHVQMPHVNKVKQPQIQAGFQSQTQTQTESQRQNWPWWCYLSIIMTIFAISLLIAYCCLRRPQLHNVAMLSPLLLAVMIPAAECHGRNMHDFSIGFHCDFSFNYSLKANTTFSISKYITNNTAQVIARISDSCIEKFSSQATTVGITIFDVTSDKLTIKKFNQNTSGIYSITEDETDAITVTFYNLTVILPPPTESPLSYTENQVFTLPPYNEARETWWAIFLICLTCLLFIGIAVKVALTKNLGVPTTIYPCKKKPVFQNPLLITTACLCLLSLPQTNAQCSVSSNNIYLEDGKPGLLNASVDMAGFTKYSWKKQIGKTETLVLVENSTKIHYFNESAGTLLSNGSYLISITNSASAGEYHLECVAKNGSSKLNKITVVDVQKCAPPTITVYTEIYKDLLSTRCRAKVYCWSTTRNPICFKSFNPFPNPDEALITSYAKKPYHNYYWYYFNTTEPQLVYCNCSNPLSRAVNSINLVTECQNALEDYNQAKALKVVYVSYHHLWWIFALMFFVAALFLAAYWWWEKHCRAKNSPEQTKALSLLKDPVEIV